MESVSLYVDLGSPYAYLAIARADAVFGCAPARGRSRPLSPEGSMWRLSHTRLLERWMLVLRLEQRRHTPAEKAADVAQRRSPTR